MSCWGVQLGRCVYVVSIIELVSICCSVVPNLWPTIMENVDDRFLAVLFIARVGIFFQGKGRCCTGKDDWELVTRERIV